MALAVFGASLSLWFLPPDLFARLDPLIGASTVFSSRVWVPFATAGLITLGLAVAFGRAWCSWICPVGSLLDLVPARAAKNARRRRSGWRYGKYVTLVIVLGGAALGWLGPIILDPVTIASRPLTELLIPAMSRDAVGAIGLRPDAVTGIALASITPLVLVLALNAFGRRTWCASLCPLGGLLAIVSRTPGIRRVVRNEICTSCGTCARSCPTAAIEPKRAFASNAGECIACTDCADRCPEDAIRFRTTVPSTVPDYDPSLRRVLTAVGSAGAGLVVAAAVPAVASEQEIMRPPSTDEERLARLCVRCGACYTACPTGVLRPSLSVGSQAGMWTPMLDVRPRHCSMKCNLCAEPCPTGALRMPSPSESRALGLDQIARIDRDRCIAWNRGRACGLCVRVCPIFGALTASGTRLPTDPRPRDIGLPVIDRDLCIGCNLCTAECPVGPPAIGTHVRATG